MRIVEYGLELDEDMVGKLIKENTKNCPNIHNEFLNNPQKISNIFRMAFQLEKKAEEYLYLVAMDAKCKAIGFFEISHGTSNASLASPKSIYQRALLCGATNIVVVHNHPSGCTEPSSADIEMAKNLKKAGALLDINLVDSVIIGGDEYYSFKEHGIVF